MASLGGPGLAGVPTCFLNLFQTGKRGVRTRPWAGLARDHTSFPDPLSPSPPCFAVTVLLGLRLGWGLGGAIIAFLLVFSHSDSDPMGYSLYFPLVPRRLCTKYTRVCINKWVMGKPLRTSKGLGKQYTVHF